MGAANATMGRTLLDKGQELRENYSTLLQQRNANRETLRNLDIQDLLTEDEKEEMLELYPPRRTSEEVAAEVEGE